MKEQKAYHQDRMSLIRQINQAQSKAPGFLNFTFQVPVLAYS